MRRCDFCKFKCTRINKLIAHIKEYHPDEYRMLSKERQSGVKEAVEKAVKTERGNHAD